MYALCLLAALPASPPEPQTVWLPRLAPGRELVYRGTVTEEADAPSIRYRQSYDLETTLFVLSAPPDGFDLAVLTILRVPPAGGGGAGSVASVRIAAAHLGLDGSLTASDGPWNVPLDGPPVLEAGVFAAPPAGRLAVGMEWDAMEPGRAPWSWRVVGTETSRGRPTWRLTGEQRSDFFDRPGLSDAGEGKLAGWRRRDTLKLSPRDGFAVAVERVVERRTAGSATGDHTLTVRYELAGDESYPGQLSASRRLEVQRALQFASQLESTSRHAETALNALRTRIEHHLETAQPTPYRVAIEATRDRIEAFRRGQDPPARELAVVPSAGLRVGRPAPDFVAEDLVTKTAWRLGKCRPRPVLLAFYDPSAASAPAVLRAAQAVADRLADRAIVAIVPVREAALALKQRAELGVTLAVLAADGLSAVYHAEATPRWLVLDRAGDLRGGAVGWGPESPNAMRRELEACLSDGERGAAP